MPMHCGGNTSLSLFSSVCFWKQLFESSLTTGWTVPVAVAGIVSQLSTPRSCYSWLDWIDKLPLSVVAGIRSVLPQLTVTIILQLFPYVLRWVIRPRRVSTA